MFVCPTCGQRYEHAGYCAIEGQPLAETDDELLGTEIERYRLARKIGEGGMGRVYLAVQPAIGARVAIKILSDECRRTPELLERFFAEARAVNLIRHENITSVLDMAVLPNGQPFIVMEFIEGQTLAEIVRSAQAPLGGVLQVMGEVLSALAAAHAIGIVHRDLKPDNILVTVEGHAKVLDFGIAKLAPGLRDVVGTATKTGAILGTPAYMAPEQINGAANVDARTDVYAAGVVLFEAVTGRQPFQGATMFDLMKAHIEQAPPSPKLYRPDLPDAIEQVIMVALAKDPAQRFQSAAAMSQALAHAGAVLTQDQWKPLSSRGGVITPRISANYTPPHPDAFRSTAVTPGGKTEAKQRRTGRVVVIAAAALLGFGATLFVIATSKSGDAPKLAVTAPADAALVTPDAARLIAEATPDAADVVEPARPPVRPAGKPIEPPVAKPPVHVDPKHADDHGPTIVGGGSAADHGVIIGDNVHIGSGVVIGGGTPAPANGPKSVTSRADYSAKSFDPVAYLPKALALAKQLAPDAMLTRFEFDPVFPDGHVDLTMNGRDHEYEFRSVARSVRPADLPRNVPVDRPCMIHVEIEPAGATATVRTSDDCTARIVRAPKCKLSSVWKQATAMGTPGDVVARISWLSDEKWFFDIDLEGKGGGVSTFPDRCP